MPEDYPGENKLGGCLAVLGVLAFLAVMALIIYGLAVRPWLELGARTSQF